MCQNPAGVILVPLIARSGLGKGVLVVHVELLADGVQRVLLEGDNDSPLLPCARSEVWEVPVEVSDIDEGVSGC